MDKLKIMKKEKTKFKNITIRVTNKLSAWIKEKKYSPTKIFNQALEELGYKE